ncbi:MULTISPECIES: response regulator transcription factor [Amycolatopsis]|uniref:DNA-binding response regulator n=1 Tax=Amycolatopsis keratiniphila subsp. keratiniphila TaxID=227715 RepID=A0A1W2LRJ6_9PSEU|nr:MULTISPECIES: response regulator transcription factor [Amycolatopsis]OLZ56320.1 DNA-binding response regulator [Amycolatopsis keratiniphila subsp. nogabecina]ONF66975.1 DNA-binding response regulator [Amycolatopsis keratiniphila subsp. keratiniphila]RSN49484.1 DNA-binding response regulator [Amycolatopsis sp. WAC 04197]SDU53289.1 DNA-binding response regulator, NarL/FixJ family, contains REC and HTH domains [Amycolatopsis keratiniphila]
MTIRVVIADDQSLVRTGLRMILDNADDIDVVGEAGDGAEAVALVADLDPDVVLMDIRMPEMDGVEATAAIAAAHRARVLVLTTFDLDEYVYAALRAGASGFLLKDALAPDLLAGVRVVASGEATLAPTVTRRLLDRVVTGLPAAPPDDRLALLTGRENEVLRQLARGLSNAEIAELLFLSPGTVKTHVGRILTKLGLRDRVQAVVFAYESGLISR